MKVLLADMVINAVDAAFQGGEERTLLTLN
jgi:hypothetical protein